MICWVIPTQLPDAADQRFSMAGLMPNPLYRPAQPDFAGQGVLMCASSQSWGCPVAQTLVTPANSSVPPEDWPADAESRCGDTPAERDEMLVDLVASASGYGQPDDAARSQAACASGCAQQPFMAQQQCGSSCAHSGCSNMDSSDTECGDDFACLQGADASRLLEEVCIEYPGGVDAALADWAAACSQQQPAAASDCVPGAQCNTTLMLPAACWQQQEQQQAAAQAALKGAALPSLAAVLLTQTQPQSLAAALLPCCQWDAFEGDAVGEVLAGRAPAPSCATSLLHY